jgi:hypothetical protein
MTPQPNTEEERKCYYFFDKLNNHYKISLNHRIIDHVNTEIEAIEIVHKQALAEKEKEITELKEKADNRENALLRELKEADECWNKIARVQQQLQQCKEQTAKEIFRDFNNCWASKRMDYDTHKCDGQDGNDISFTAKDFERVKSKYLNSRSEVKK